jgi:thiol-disulfide isomerase/thioredoxin
MDRAPRPEEGNPLPPLQLQALISPPPTLDDLAGAPALLFFYNLGCTGCLHRGLPLAQRIQEVYPQLRIIAIHVDLGRHTYPTEAILAEAQIRNLQLEHYRDRGSATYEAYGAEGTPHWILIDVEGRLHRSLFGSMEGVQVRLDYILRELFS